MCEEIRPLSCPPHSAGARISPGKGLSLWWWHLALLFWSSRIETVACVLEWASARLSVFVRWGLGICMRFQSLPGACCRNKLQIRSFIFGRSFYTHGSSSCVKASERRWGAEIWAVLYRCCLSARRWTPSPSAPSHSKCLGFTWVICVETGLCAMDTSLL